MELVSYQNQSNNDIWGLDFSPVENSLEEIILKSQPFIHTSFYIYIFMHITSSTYNVYHNTIYICFLKVNILTNHFPN